MIHRFLNAISLLAVITYTIIIQTTLIANENQGDDFLILNEALYSGLGAEFSAVLGALDAYDKGEYTGIEIDLDSGIFLDPATGPNWWEYYFDPICLGDKYSFNYYHSSIGDSCLFSHRAFNCLSKHRSYELIQKYVHVKPVIQDAVDAFVNENFNNCFVIGVHHRGTDKVTEVNMVPWQLTLAVLKHTIKHLPKKNRKRLKIYVATDDQYFLDYLLEFYPSRIVYGDFFRSTNNQPLHTYESQYYSNNYEKGKEAVIEALILSRCDALIRPSSSGFSWVPTVFSPNMPVNPIWCGDWVYPGKWSPPLRR